LLAAAPDFAVDDVSVSESGVELGEERAAIEARACYTLQSVRAAVRV
jgi:hypothetical protein